MTIIAPTTGSVSTVSSVFKYGSNSISSGSDSCSGSGSYAYGVSYGVPKIGVSLG
ncbi:hypothetical protein DDB_G0291898 [Dictyostelium discoideum AX4]|uniref:Putative uncharacterized protein DDB_G0291898 n=1 Tax=Dictyostelium discoideum TaxID=44689 RepID=Y4124_DICDI|nr:hypothetical protein DDB_G0291898 [Dictyostelium discoideum AX4]Q54DZ6.1 RecName: Full=Putative uncharacterized protein DDB_G0291898 [Dictyostelium discoideum]EAL61479.1 hypothetical protein DDB_G0291898 [Dictyostelium discoideum AX4]|eukprot:XP_629900.1 hypothetical protein DDB_G0291898 [Dictyostelium discoideum AX4]